MSESDRSWYAKNRERKLANMRKRWVKNRSELILKKRAYYSERKNEDAFKAINLSRSLEYQKKNKKIVGARNKRYRESHKQLFAGWEAERRFIKNQAMPAWVDRAAIRAVYTEAAARTRATGIQHHVDHRFPLRGKGFVGLHVPWNLQVLTATENMSKGNRVPQ